MTANLARLAALCLVLCGVAFTGHAAAKPARGDASAAGLAEVRRAFTLNGKPIPPEIFRDFGDGNMADSESIWVTVDLEAASGSNLYADEIKKSGSWFSQSGKKGDLTEETSYRYIGATENGLLVALAAYSGGGSGTFYTLHILDLAATRAFDSEGKVYTRIVLTCLRGIPLGDRWDGDVSIAKNEIRVVTTRDRPAGGTRAPRTIVAKRP